MRIFVTGLTGFIGGHLVRELLGRADKGTPAEIYCLVRDPAGVPADIARHPRLRLLQGDHTALDRHAQAIRSCQVIYHLGGCATFSKRGDYQGDNVEFTKVLTGLVRGSAALQRFVFTSTVGAVERVPADDCSQPLDELSAPDPSSAYGKSKLACEKILEASDLPYVIIRPVWVYGSSMRPDSHLRFFIQAVDSRRPFTRFNFPGRVSVIHVSDLVSALILAGSHPAALRQVFFASDGQPVSLGQVFGQFGEWLGRPAGRIRIPLSSEKFFWRIRPRLPVTAQSLFSDVLYASNEKLCRLGFSPVKKQTEGFLELLHDHFAARQTAVGEKKKRAVVTGSAGGIGRALCEQLFARGWEVTGIDKNEQAAPAGQDSWRVIQADLSDETQVDSVCGRLRDGADTIDLWINNAGVGKKGGFAEIDAISHDRVLKTNCLAPVVLGRFILQFFKEKKSGILVNISSSAAFQPLPSMAVYAASKAFLLSWSEAVGVEAELAKSGVKVITVCPSGAATKFQQTAGVRGEKGLLPASAVARRILRALSGPSRTVIIGPSARLMAFAARVLPRRLQALMWRRLMEKLR